MRKLIGAGAATAALLLAGCGEAGQDNVQTVVQNLSEEAGDAAQNVWQGIEDAAGDFGDEIGGDGNEQQGNAQ